MVSLLFWGLTIRVLGELLIIYSVIRVHIRIVQEHKLDKKVYRSIGKEKTMAVIGIIFIIFGYFLEIAHYSTNGLF
jgi:hypothetical protein